VETELETCPVCEGEHIVEKILNGKICYYADRITAIKEPCEFCNGSGVVTKEKLGNSK